MNNILMLNTIKDYNDFMQVETVHPQVSVINMSDIPPLRHARKNMGFYTIFLKEIKCADSLQYGRRQYDYQENTLIFIGPGQIIGNNDNGETFQPKGWCLTFHPELLHGTSLGRRIQEYTFFTYAINEALHISKQERETLIDCMMKINEEIKGGTDKHSNQIIVSTIELFLNYCVRFYDRQFATRINESKDILHSFETLLNGYFVSEKPQSFGTPTVAYCADQLHLSPNYFGDLIKKETGRTAQEYILSKTMEVAKNLLAEPSRSISDIAYTLGYQYPQYFSRAFKRVVGYSPNEYRMSN